MHDSELLNHLIITERKSGSDKVVDIRDIILQKAKLEGKNLSKSHNSVVSAAYENFLGVSNLHRCIINVLDQKTLLDLLNTLGKDIKKILRASKVKLCIYSNALPNLDHPNWKPLSKLEMINLMRTAKQEMISWLSFAMHGKELFHRRAKILFLQCGIIRDQVRVFSNDLPI